MSWQGLNFDFTGVVFDGGDFTDARFSGGIVLFTGTVSSGGEVSFHRAAFSGSTVYFAEAKFSGGTVDLTNAALSGGEVGFDRARFSGGTVSFAEARNWADPPTFSWDGKPPRGLVLPVQPSDETRGKL